MIRGVIFDLDGTILNTIDDLSEMMDTMLTRFGYPTIPLDAHKRAIGYGARNYVKNALPSEAAKDEQIVEKCYQVFYELYQKNPNEKTMPYRGIPEMMQFLREQGIKMAILSNKPDVATQTLAKQWFAGCGLTCVYGERAGVPRKPDAGAALAVAEEMGLSPEDIVFVGDGETDIKTAMNAGMLPVGVLWGFRTEEQLREAGGKVFVNTPEELIELVKRENNL